MMIPETFACAAPFAKIGIFLRDGLIAMSALIGIKLTVIIILCAASCGIFPIHILAAEMAAQIALQDSANMYLKDAVGWYYQASVQNPDWPLPYLQSMRLDLIRQDCPSALNTANAALKALPGSANVWQEAASVSAACGRSADQLKDLQNAYYLAPTAQNAADLIYAYLRNGLPRLALQQNLNAYSINDLGWLYIGIADLHIGQISAARIIFTKPANIAGLTWFLQYRQLALLWHNTPEDMFQLGMLDLSAQLPILAEDAFAMAQKNGYIGADLAENKAWAYWIAGDITNAQTALATANPHSAKTVGLRAAIALKFGHADLAESMLQNWIRYSGQVPDAIWLLLAQAGMQNHMYSVAEQAYWSLLQQTDPARQYQYVVALCNFYIQTGLGKSEPLAQTAFNLLLQAKMQVPAGAIALEQWLVWQGRAPAAEDVLTRSIAMFPQNAALRCASAALYTALGNLSMAKTQDTLADQISLYGCG